MRQMIWRIAIGLVGGIFVAMLLKWALDISPAMIVTTVVLVTLTNVILEELEKDSATKRFLKKYFKMLAVLGVFLGIRIAAQYLFDMPLSSSVASIFGRKPISSSVNDAILEFFFLIPGLGAAYAVMYGSVSKKLVYWVSVGCFFFILWEIKQPNHAQSLGHRSQAKIDVWARHNWQIEKAHSIEANKNLVEVVRETRVYEAKTTDTLGFSHMKPKPDLLKPGQMIRLMADPAVEYRGQLFVHMRCPEWDQQIIDGGVQPGDPVWNMFDNLWVSAEALKIEEPQLEQPRADTVQAVPTSAIVRKKALGEPAWATCMVGEKSVPIDLVYDGDKIVYISTRPFYVHFSDGPKILPYPASKKGDSKYFYIAGAPLGAMMFVNGGPGCKPFQLRVQIFRAG